MLRVNIPQLEIGDMVHAVVRSTVTRAFIPGEYAEDFMFEGNGYVRHLSLEVRMPADKPLRQVALRDEIPGTVAATSRTEAGQLVYHWEVSQRAADVRRAGHAARTRRSSSTCRSARRPTGRRCRAGTGT